MERYRENQRNPLLDVGLPQGTPQDPKLTRTDPFCLTKL